MENVSFTKQIIPPFFPFTSSKYLLLNNVFSNENEQELKEPKIEINSFIPKRNEKKNWVARLYEL